MNPVIKHYKNNNMNLIKEGMVFTVEPGIYIPGEGMGIRLENNIVVQDNGYLDLMGDIPVEAEEIEDLMNSWSNP